jgi:hypothetical protein
MKQLKCSNVQFLAALFWANPWDAAQNSIQHRNHLGVIKSIHCKVGRLSNIFSIVVHDSALALVQSVRCLLMQVLFAVMIEQHIPTTLSLVVIDVTYFSD